MIVFGTAEYQLPMVAFLVGTLGLLAMLLGWVHVPLSGLAAIVLAVMSSHFLCLFPRKVIDISWSDLSAALYYALVPLNTQAVSSFRLPSPHNGLHNKMRLYVCR